MKRLRNWLILALFCLFVPVSSQDALLVSAQDSPFTIQTIVIEDMPVYNMRISPDGQTAALYIGDSSRVLLNVPVLEYTIDASLLPIRLIDLNTGAELGRLTGHTDYVADVAFTPDSQQLASAHLNGDLYLWDIASMRSIRSVTALMGQTKLEFLPDGKTLVMYKPLERIGHFFLWDMETGYMTRIWRAPYPSFGELQLLYAPASLEYIYAASSVSPDGTLLATANASGEVILWDTDTLQQTLVQPRAPDADRGRFNIRTVMFSADSKTLVYFDSLSEQTHFWDIESRTETTVLPFGGPSFGLSPQNDRLAWATSEGVSFADLDQPDNPVKVLDSLNRMWGTGPSALPVVAFSPDGSRIVIGGMGFPPDGDDNVLYVVTIP